MDLRRSPRLKFALLAAVLVLAGFFTRSLWLPVFGYALVRDDGPAKADIVVVLAGDSSGLRILKAAELVRQGYAPRALISGSADFYGLNECDAAIPFAVRHGYPAEWFIPFPSSALSTREEAIAILPELRRRGVHSFLLVTSDFHTARATRLFRWAERAAGGGPALRAIPAPDLFFHAGSWWRTRQSQKIFFEEWCKTVAAAVGI